MFDIMSKYTMKISTCDTCSALTNTDNHRLKISLTDAGRRISAHSRVAIVNLSPEEQKQRIHQLAKKRKCDAQKIKVVSSKFDKAEKDLQTVRGNTNTPAHLPY